MTSGAIDLDQVARPEIFDRCRVQRQHSPTPRRSCNVLGSPHGAGFVNYKSAAGTGRVAKAAAGSVPAQAKETISERRLLDARRALY